MVEELQALSRTRSPEQGAPRAPGAVVPPGFEYHAGFVDPDEEERLVGIFGGLPLKEFEFRGHLGRRRVVSYGWRYDFGGRALERALPIPEFLLPLRQRVARFAGVPAERLAQSSVIEYRPGTTIGWHRDKDVFGDVIGLSFASAAVLRFRRQAGTGWERSSIALEPRSVYLLRGDARHEWQHSLRAVPALRYSLTFRTLRDVA